MHTVAAPARRCARARLASSRRASPPTFHAASPPAFAQLHTDMRAARTLPALRTTYLALLRQHLLTYSHLAIPATLWRGAALIAMRGALTSLQRRTLRVPAPYRRASGREGARTTYDRGHAPARTCSRFLRATYAHARAATRRATPARHPMRRTALIPVTATPHFTYTLHTLPHGTAPLNETAICRQPNCRHSSCLPHLPPSLFCAALAGTSPYLQHAFYLLLHVCKTRLQHSSCQHGAHLLLCLPASLSFAFACCRGSAYAVYGVSCLPVGVCTMVETTAAATAYAWKTATLPPACGLYLMLAAILHTSAFTCFGACKHHLPPPHCHTFINTSATSTLCLAQHATTSTCLPTKSALSPTFVAVPPASALAYLRTALPPSSSTFASALILFLHALPAFLHTYAFACHTMAPV